MALQHSHKHEIIMLKTQVENASSFLCVEQVYC